MADSIYRRFKRSPLLWMRASGCAMIAVLCVSTLTQTEQLVWQVPAWLTVLTFLSYAAAFLRNTAPFPQRARWQTWVLLIQIALSMPFDGSLSVVTAITIPLVIERRRRLRWLIGTILSVGALLLGRTIVGLIQNWSRLPAGTNWTKIAVSLSGGMLELMAWHSFAFLAALLIVQFDADRRRLAQLNAELRGSHVLLLDSGRLAERLRISRELHDSMGHHLISMSLQLEAAAHLPCEQLRDQLAQVRYVAKLLLADIREAVSEWRIETSTALPDALRELTGAVTGTKVRLEVDGSAPALAPTVTHSLFRITQEAITNALKHGAPGEIHVRLRYTDGSTDLEIEDNGRGVDSLRLGNGLTGIKSRVAEIGGTVSFTTARYAGFRIAIQVPREEESRA